MAEVTNQSQELERESPADLWLDTLVLGYLDECVFVAGQNHSHCAPNNPPGILEMWSKKLLVGNPPSPRVFVVNEEINCALWLLFRE